MFAVMYGGRLFSSVFAITERRDMGLYEVQLHGSPNRPVTSEFVGQASQNDTGTDG